MRRGADLALAFGINWLESAGAGRAAKYLSHSHPVVQTRDDKGGAPGESRALSADLESAGHAQVVVEDHGDGGLVFLVADLDMAAAEGLSELLGLLFAAEMAGVLAVVVLGAGVIAVLDDDGIAILTPDIDRLDFAVGAGPAGGSALAEFLPEGLPAKSTSASNGNRDQVMEDAVDRFPPVPPMAMERNHNGSQDTTPGTK